MNNANIHSSRDAMVWTREFIEKMKKFRENDKLVDEAVLDEGYMIGWFANAMMAMHDSLYQNEFKELEEENKKLRECVEFYSTKTTDCWVKYTHRHLFKDDGRYARQCLAELKKDEK